jgi:hypothetical protein
MKITEEIRATYGPIERHGMEEKAREFVERGGEIYQ